jgi:hypothetical protein
MTPAAAVIPPAVLRRLTLSLLGWRFTGGVWAGPTGPLLTEEAVDAMSPRRWAACVRRWRASAGALN